MMLDPLTPTSSVGATRAAKVRSAAVKCFPPAPAMKGLVGAVHLPGRMDHSSALGNTSFACSGLP